MSDGFWRLIAPIMWTMLDLSSDSAASALSPTRWHCRRLRLLVRGVGRAAASKFIAVAAPVSNQPTCRLAHRHRHLDRALGRIGAWHGIVEEHHDPVAGKLVERALELGSGRTPNSRVAEDSKVGRTGGCFQSVAEVGVVSPTKFDQHILAEAIDLTIVVTLRRAASIGVGSCKFDQCMPLVSRGSSC